MAKHKSHKHIALWGAWYGSHNVGDQVLLLTIADILASQVGSLRFTVFTDDPDHVNAYTSSESQWRFRAIHNRRQFHEVVRTLFSCDLFVFGGGVPFYEERAHIRAMALLAGMARTFGTPYMIWTVSSQEVHSTLAKRVFGWVLNSAAGITYRDDHTRKLFEACGVTKPMELAGDSGFWLEPAEDRSAVELIARSGNRATDRPLVALTPRTLRGRDGDAQKHYNVKTLSQYEQEIACFVSALDWLWEQGYQPLIVPMNTVAPDDDRIAAREVIQASRHGKHALLIDEEVRPRIAPAVYRQCRASFVARVHGSITSMVANCPVMMYAFAPKHAGIMSSMGLSEYSLEEKDATPQAAVERLSCLLSERDQLRTFMNDRLVYLRQQALIPACMAADILHGDRR